MYVHKVDNLPLRSILITPALRNRISKAFSFAFISLQISSTTRIKLTSAFMKIYSPPGLSAWHSATMRSAASWDRPTKYARGLYEYWANFFSVISPIPLVAPTKRAIRPVGNVVGMRELEARMIERDTIAASCFTCFGRHISH